MNVEIEREADGRRIAEAPEFPGAMAYGVSTQEATANVEMLVLHVIAATQQAPGRE